MKHGTKVLVAVGIIALLVGLAAGRTWQQSEVRRLRAEVERLQNAPAPVAAVSPAVRRRDLPEREWAPRPATPAATSNVAGAVTDAESATASAPQPPAWWWGGGSGGETNVRAFTPPTEEQRREWAERRQQEMRERAERQRTNFIAKAELDEGQTTRLDVLVSAMNVRLGERMQVWKDYLASNSLPRSEVRARVMNDVSSVMVLTYNELDRSMPADWRTQAGEDFSLHTFIDPQLWQEMRPLVGRGFGRGPGPGPGPGPSPSGTQPQPGRSP
jgi:hypothetical protein